tara:strand:+ start:388 stop:603 length:216 start_codon:yes stop_codon:yes gene_type:complete
MKIKSYSNAEVDSCRKAGKITATILDELNSIIKEGISTSEIDEFCLTRIQELVALLPLCFIEDFQNLHVPL